MPIKNYRDLVAWQKAMDFVEDVYRLTRGFPREELYGLTNQLRRCSVSIPSNIAEGQGRRTDPEFAHRLSIAHGSVREAETQLMIGARLGYLKESELLRADCNALPAACCLLPADRDHAISLPTAYCLLPTDSEDD